MNLLDEVLNAAYTSQNPKSLVDLHPETLERQHIITVLHGEQPLAAPLSYLAALGDHESHVWTRKAVSLLAQSFAQLPLSIIRDGEIVESHDLLRLLSDVNDKMSTTELHSQWIVDMLLGGEEGWELIKSAGGKYVEIWPRQPHTINILPDRANLRYFGVSEYRIDDGLPGNVPGQRGFTLPPEEFILFKFFNPRNAWRGLSVISAVRNAIVIDLFAQAWSRLFFRKHARPDFAVISEAMTKSERDEIKAELKANYSGAENWFEPIVLEKGVTDIKPLDFRPRDMEYLAQREMSRDEIGGMFGVPDILMGFGNDSYDTEEKRRTAERALWTLTLMPLANYRDTALTEFFRRARTLAPNESLVSDYGSIGVLRDDKGALITQGVSLFDRGIPWSVINDYLGLGLPEFPRWDVGYLPLGLTPVTNAGAKRSLPSARKGLIRAPEFGSDGHKALWEQKDRRLDPQRKKMKRQLAQEFERQAREVKRRLRKAARAILVHANGHDVIEKQNVDDVFDADDEAERFEREFKGVVMDALRSAGQDELDRLGLGVDFDLDRPEVRAVMKDILHQFAEKVNDTTYDDLAALFEQAEADGASTADIIERLDEYFDGRKDDASLERIARTTMTAANGAGDVTAWEQSGVVERREWLAALDDRTRDDHREAHGQERDLDEPFDVGGEELDYPGDPAGSPENIIQCRCSQTAIVK
jgi:HK97 family phage portal protein